MSAVTLHEGDNRVSLRRLIDQGVRVHSVVTDPPYGLTSIMKRFGKDGAAPAKFGTDGAFARAGAGFMGSKWDGTGIERDPEFWRLVWEILLPGGYVVAFSSSRTGHWQACAMEMAGFVMHPFLGWVFGSGFPKAHNAAMAIDRQLKVEGGRGAPKSAAHAGWIDRGAMRGADGNDGWQREWMQDAEKVAAAASKYLPGSPEAQQWEGWAYGGQAMKPALEPIYVGQRPFDQKNGALNLLKHGVGAINIDGCRVAFADASDEAESKSKNQHSDFGSGAMTNQIYGKFSKDRENYNPPGRHPANLLTDGSDDVVALFPQSGGSGSAARFFNSFPPDADPLFYRAKATKADRAGSKHPTVKPIALMQWLCRLVTPSGGTILDPFAGSGTTGEAARRQGFDCILMEAEAEFAGDIRRRFDLPSDSDDFDALIRPFPTLASSVLTRTEKEQTDDSFDTLLGAL